MGTRGKALGIEDKSDRVDACVLALYGLKVRPKAHALPPATQRQLQTLSRYRDTKQLDLQAQCNQLRHLELPAELREEA